MKTLLLATDFSETGNHAVKYGYRLAQQLQANVMICHAFMIPAELPQVGIVVWPTEVHEDILEDNENKLQQIKQELKKSVHGTFIPSVKLLNEIGPVAEVLKNAGTSEAADMIIMGTHHEGINTLLLANHSKTMIDYLKKPLLLVPPKAKISLPGKISFASDFRHPGQDLEMILSLMPLIRSLNAELHITHIQPTGHHSEHKLWEIQFLNDIVQRSSYSKISTKIISDDNRVAALEKLSSGFETDLLVMVHHHHGFFEEIFKGSYTKKTAKNTAVPLLILHSNE
ncbi:nucleotide-binding universal stress UspA family protein [Mucilaginibacter gracilis]|uniref:Nucleotide-binding universal stress UspA family protein n=1 Tax=Mucilaginibacter gracilis TaxID=423350 RepID=A0A495IZ28_9SPHI|nr:universal stress protein [Mucilaginibacter gracilis]RKR81980.1 nucleotide-binding universal stress UspA family protein [Mucilaginibacter gracilis]